MKVACVNDKKPCGHFWDYKGKSKKYISCPLCYYRFRLKRARVLYLAHTTDNEDYWNIVFSSKDKPKKSLQSPRIHENQESDVLALPDLPILPKALLPRFIAGMDMKDGVIVPYDKLPKIPGYNQETQENG